MSAKTQNRMDIFAMLKSQRVHVFGPKSRILPPNLNTNWMTAVIGPSRHVNQSSIGRG